MRCAQRAATDAHARSSVPQQRRVLLDTPDPDDDYLVALAQAADIDVIVSGDDHLSDVTGCVVKTPREFLTQIESEKEESSTAEYERENRDVPSPKRDDRGIGD